MRKLCWWEKPQAFPSFLNKSTYSSARRNENFLKSTGTQRLQTDSPLATCRIVFGPTNHLTCWNICQHFESKGIHRNSQISGLCLKIRNTKPVLLHDNNQLEVSNFWGQYVLNHHRLTCPLPTFILPTWTSRHLRVRALRTHCLSHTPISCFCLSSL